MNMRESGGGDYAEEWKLKIVKIVDQDFGYQPVESQEGIDITGKQKKLEQTLTERRDIYLGKEAIDTTKKGFPKQIKERIKAERDGYITTAHEVQGEYTERRKRVDGMVKSEPWLRDLIQKMGSDKIKKILESNDLDDLVRVQLFLDKLSSQTLKDQTAFDYYGADDIDIINQRLRVLISDILANKIDNMVTDMLSGSDDLYSKGERFDEFGDSVTILPFQILLVEILVTKLGELMAKRETNLANNYVKEVLDGQILSLNESIKRGKVAQVFKDQIYNEARKIEGPGSKKAEEWESKKSSGDKTL